MSHARQQIRESVAALVTGLTTTGTKVFQSRMRPQAESKLPCLLVTTNDEQIDSASVGNLQQRSITLVIRGIAMGGATLDDTLDQIALEVETAMASDYRSALEKIEIDFDDELEKPIGSISLTYKTTVITASGNPGVML